MIPLSTSYNFYDSVWRCQIKIHVGVFGEKHFWFLPALLNSFAENWANADLHIDYAEIGEKHLDLIRDIFPSATFRLVDMSVISSGGHSVRASHNVQLRYSFLCEVVNDGENILFIDADMIIHKSPEDLLIDLKEADLVITTKKGKFPLNAAVIFTRKNVKTLEFFRRYLIQTNELLLNQSEVVRRTKVDGSPDQSIFIDLLGIRSHIKNPNVQAVYVVGKDLQMSCRVIPCEVLNQTESVPLSAKTFIYHVKSGWHRALIDGGKFSRNRRKVDSEEILRLWAYHNVSGLRKGLNSYAKNILKEQSNFGLKVREYQKGGIFPSEMHLICAIFKSLEVSLVVESGRRNGFSTEYMAQSLPEVKIFSIELDRGGQNKERESFLKGFDNLELLYGNTIRLLPKILKRVRPNPSLQNIGIVIDGPKGLRAILLAHKIIKNHHQVKCIVIHDMRKRELGRLSLTRAIADRIFDRIMFSDDLEVDESFLELDSIVFGEDWSTDSWVPYKKGFELVGSYGPTLAIIVPSKTDMVYNNRWLSLVLKLNGSRGAHLLMRFLLKGST
jgi:hypothetical protein